MEESTYNSTEREATIIEMNNLLTQLNQHAAYLKKANKMLKKIDADTVHMEKYYYSDWVDDYEYFDRGGALYDVLLQDPIHNALQEIYQEKIKLLKQIVSKLM